MTAPEPTLPVTDRRAYGADDDDDLPVDVVRFAQFSLAADTDTRPPRVRVSLHAHDTVEAAREGMKTTNRGVSVGYLGQKMGPLGGECHEFEGMGIVLSCFIDRFNIRVNAADLERGWEVVNLIGVVIAGDSVAPGGKGQR